MLTWRRSIAKLIKTVIRPEAITSGGCFPLRVSLRPTSSKAGGAGGGGPKSRPTKPRRHPKLSKKSPEVTPNATQVTTNHPSLKTHRLGGPPSCLGTPGSWRPPIQPHPISTSPPDGPENARLPRTPRATKGVDFRRNQMTSPYGMNSEFPHVPAVLEACQQKAACPMLWVGRFLPPKPGRAVPTNRFVLRVYPLTAVSKVYPRSALWITDRPPKLNGVANVIGRYNRSAPTAKAVAEAEMNTKEALGAREQRRCLEKWTNLEVCARRIMARRKPENGSKSRPMNMEEKSL